ncbi:MAG: hypothetical protein EBZ69_02510 [Alphaproteobacteria bacterium]|nr:hypothetical protein [Alphaproteobacteria bacterium]NDC55675.1 hypothetical protein [Alphaproteobacteria bacterium]NDG04469.1 hypothetical protein [Alphaproteobacteria bacterium]
MKRWAVQKVMDTPSPLSNKSPPCVHAQWFDEAFRAAAHSPHPHVKVGALIINDAEGKKTLLASACNDFAEGVLQRPERLNSGEKSFWLMCAEKRAIHAARTIMPASLHPCALYATLDPCHTCADDIIGAGIKTVYVPLRASNHYPELKEKWQKSMTIGAIKMHESGVRVVYVRL